MHRYYGQPKAGLANAARVKYHSVLRTHCALQRCKLDTPLLAAAAKAIAELPQGKNDDVTTANIGMIFGGSGVNIVSEQCMIQGEIRSLCHEKAVAFARLYQRQFAKEAQDFGASAEWKESIDIQAYETSIGRSNISRYAGVAE